MNITFELDLNRKFILRKCYSFLDLLSDMGGIVGILMGFFSSVVSCFNFNNFDNYMVSRLFKFKKIDAKTNLSKPYFQRAEFIDHRKYRNLLEYLINKMPCLKHICCCKCCRKSRAQRGMDKAREKIMKEINIVEIVKKLRYVTDALNYLLPEKKRFEIKQRNRYVQIDPDIDDFKRQETEIQQNLTKINLISDLTSGFYSSARSSGIDE